MLWQNLEVMAKNIVICCDGTGNQFGDKNSNIIKLFSVLSHDDPQQMLYYHPGVGTTGSMEKSTFFGAFKRKVKKLHAFAYGYGMISNVAHAYAFLMNNFEPEDRIFIFGFSRGAYTARALCSMLKEFGLLENGNQVLIEYAMNLLQSPTRHNLKLAEHFKGIFGRRCRPYFVGVWDTVESAGWIYDPLDLPFMESNSDIQIGRQALAIDERRCNFRPSLWDEPAEGQDLKQVWFAGVHCDVGGSYARKESGLSNISLKWMLDEAEKAGLRINEAAKDKLFQEVPPSPHAKIHESLKSWWWLLEYLPKKNPPQVRRRLNKSWSFCIGHHRRIPENSFLHESVLARLHSPADNYHPKNLPAKFRVEKPLSMNRMNPTRSPQEDFTTSLSH